KIAVRRQLAKIGSRSKANPTDFTAFPLARAAIRRRLSILAANIEQRSTMSDANSKLARLARPHAERAILRLAAIVDNGHQPSAPRVAAARALLELACGRPACRPRAKPPAAIPRVAEVNWGDPTE